MAPVDVWWAAPADLSRRAGLDVAEQARLATMVHAADRNRFTTGRTLLRHLVAARSGVAPDAVVIDATCPQCGGPHGRPRIIAAGSPMFASVAHAGERVLVAAAEHPLGVDVEPLAAAGFAGFDDVALTVREQAQIAATAPGERPGRRAAMWVRKEAALKLSGAALDRSPDRIDHADPAFRFVDLDVGPEYRAALAVPAGTPVVLRVSDARALVAGAAG